MKAPSFLNVLFKILALCLLAVGGIVGILVGVATELSSQFTKILGLKKPVMAEPQSQRQSQPQRISVS